MLFTHTFQFLIAFVVSTVVLSLAAARVARSSVRRRFDLGVVSQRWLLTHRAEE